MRRMPLAALTCAKAGRGPRGQTRAMSTTTHTATLTQRLLQALAARGATEIFGIGDLG